ncbi:hypothetical protein GCM10009809_08330 [Isoptericola hypogeus]|uniref:Anti-sigma factor n=1 Tax=Isoptericola hypogeus TaxID=300179 RepID=A0ABN2IZ22_9MICO
MTDIAASLPTPDLVAEVRRRVAEGLLEPDAELAVLAERLAEQEGL